MSKSIQGANRVPSLPRSEGDDRCLFSTCRPTCAGSMSLMERVKRDLNVRHSLKCDLGLIDEFFRVPRKSSARDVLEIMFD